ncbi:hypothetical protein D9611_013049 [Ephemerocybe angulata]|uniref:Uncharacterized protein n=1 Tax=Ephemerocybe angulata TaxID=980116 RepID=A0A8H5AUX3_9AGAR|nr:hypothetical protein D9611_013049 [Tulosesus angulatus]
MDVDVGSSPLTSSAFPTSVQPWSLRLSPRPTVVLIHPRSSRNYIALELDGDLPRSLHRSRFNNALRLYDSVHTATEDPNPSPPPPLPRPPPLNAATPHSPFIDYRKARITTPWVLRRRESVGVFLVDPPSIFVFVSSSSSFPTSRSPSLHPPVAASSYDDDWLAHDGPSSSSGRRFWASILAHRLTL